MSGLDARSEANLAGVHPDLVAVVRAARQRIPFIVTEGLRSAARQRQLVAEGRSQTLHSRHLTGHAVDLVDPAGSYAWAAMAAIAAAMQAAANELGVVLEWGGDWVGFKDTPHFQLPQAVYPAGAVPREAAVIEAEVLPQAAPAPVAAAFKQSKTVLGSLLALLGGALAYLQETARLLLEVAGEITGLAPIQAALAGVGVNLPAIGFGLTVFGATLAVTRRLDAAAKGRIG